MASLHLQAAVLATLGLAAGCGGQQNRAGAADTAGAVAVTPDSTTPAAPADTASAAAADTGMKAMGDTAKQRAAAPAPKPAVKPAAKPATRKPAAPAKQMAAAGARTAHDSAMAPSGQAVHDTARVQAAESTKSAATPAPAPTPQQQDTAKATANAGTDSGGGATSSDQPLRDAYHQAPRDTVTQAVYDGWKQFNLNCARCHGEDALGTTIAPHLILSLKPDGPINTKELFVQTVCAGRPTKGMPSWCALGLGMDKINDIYQYVKGRSDAKISPGRPAVKEQG